MSYKISVSENGKYIRITITGTITVGLAREFSVDSIAASEAHGIERFLYDARTARNLSSILDNYRFAYEESSDLKLSHAARSAILAAADDESHKFVVTTFRNAGFNVRGFTDEAEAIAWLEEK